MLRARKSFFTRPVLMALGLAMVVVICVGLIIHPPMKWGKEPHKILLVGNGLSTYNNMPRMLEKMLNDGSQNTHYYDVLLHVEGGYTLSDHNWKKKYAWKVYNKRPDIVFLQEHSSTIFYKEERPESVTAINHMVKVARYYHAAPRLLQTWPRGQNNDFYKDQDDESVIKAKNPDEMAAEQSKYHQIMAQKNHIPNVETTAAWQCMVYYHPQIALYSHDDNYPTVAGSYLMAVGIYKSVHGHMPRRDTWAPRAVSDDIQSKIFDCVRDPEISV